MSRLKSTVFKENFSIKSVFSRVAYDLLFKSEPVADPCFSSDSDNEANEEDQPVVDVRFEDLNLSPELMNGLYAEKKFARPSKIQSMSLPLIVTPPYKNVIVQAPNDTGKTTCSVLGMLSRVDPTLPAPQAISLSPTRPGMIEIMEVVQKIGKFTGITSEICLFDIPVSERAPVTAQVITGGPGTICQLIAANKLDTSNLKIIVFEEAQLLLGNRAFQIDGFSIVKEAVRWNPECQVLLFCSKPDDNVKAFASTIVNDLDVQEFHELFGKKEKPCVDSIKQYKVNLPNEAKIKVVRDKILAFGEGLQQMIIHVETIKSAEDLHEALVEYGYEVTTITPYFAYEDRQKLVKEFKDGSIRILIAAAILDFQFDNSQVNLVVNYDLPVEYCEPGYKKYLHQIGRAGRFGRKGAVFNLLCDDEDRVIMESIERHFNYNVTEVPSWESDHDFKDALKKAGLM